MEQAPGTKWPQVSVQRLLNDLELVFAVLAAVNLGLADLLTYAPRTIGEIADATGTHAPSLQRLIRTLVSRGVFCEQEGGRFALTEEAEPLRADAPDSVRRQALWQGSESYLQTWTALTHSVRTGECAFEHVHGQPFFDYLAGHPELARKFDDVMTASSGQDEGEAIVDSYDFGAHRQVVDVGGGHGALLTLILNRYPNVSGVLFDASDVIASTDERFDRLVTAGQATKMSGNFFQTVPVGGDAYVLKFIIHDWGDEPAVTILRNCREAMREDGKVLLVEIIRPAGDPIPESTFLDLTMLLFLHGRERTEAEYRQVLESAGLRLQKVTPTASPFSIIEAVKR